MCTVWRKGIFYPFLHTVHIFVKIINFFKFTLIKSTRFSPTRPHWAELVIESPCPSVCVSVCVSVCLCVHF